MDLVGFGGVEGEATAINAVGQVVGFSRTRAGHRRAFLFSGGRLRDLGTLGGAEASATDINAAGQVVGESETANGETHAFLWSRGRMTDLGTLGRPGSTAAAINDAGTVVGTVVGAQDNSGSGLDNGTRAFQWRAGRMTQLASLAPGTNIPGAGYREQMRATDINFDGDVVGIGSGGGSLVRWHLGVPTIVFGVCCVLGIATARINRPGDILGYYFPSHIPTTLFWRAGSTERVVGPLGSRSFADVGRSINDHHEFVGGYNDRSGTSTRLPYLSIGDSSLLDLTTRGLVENDTLNDINNSGWIVGSTVVGDATHPALFLP